MTASRRLPMLLLKTLLVIVILGIVLRQLDWDRTCAVAADASLAPIVLALLLFLLNRVLTAIKWNILLRQNRVEVGLPRLVRAMFVSSFLGIIIPSGLGADVIRLVQIGREQRKLTESASSVMADRMLAIVALSVLSCIAAILAVPRVDNPAVIRGVFTIAALLTILILGIMGRFSFLVYEQLERLTVRGLERVQGGRSGRMIAAVERVRAVVRTIHESFGALLRSPVVFTQVLVMNLLVQAVRVLQIAALFHALHTPVPWPVLVAFVPMIILLTLLPVSPFLGIGVKEGAFVYLFSQAGIPAEVSFSVSILSHLVLLTGLLPGAVMAMKGESEVAS